MPKLTLPATNPDTIEVREYSVGTPRHVRALAKYLYERIPSNILHTLIITLMPHLSEDQLSNIMSVRLKKLSKMNLEQIEEIMKGI
ncbi:MAG: hypothetical protein ACXABY_02645 [Candidatus Thorarchaeota archaeon]|jgi:hypothetical protein